MGSNCETAAAGDTMARIGRYNYTVPKYLDMSHSLFRLFEPEGLIEQRISQYHEEKRVRGKNEQFLKSGGIVSFSN